MKISNISIFNSNASQNKTGLKNNSPAFGALKADAADFLIKKAANLDEKDQITVLRSVLRLAQRAKQSFVLDIGFSPLPEAKDFTRLIFIEPAKAKGGLYKGVFGDIVDITKSKKTGEVVVVTEELAKKPDMSLNPKKIRVSTPINQFIDEIIKAFNFKEAEIVSKKTVTESLAEQINALVTK